MVTPFRLQACEYDCVPTTFINAVTYLFTRKEIPPLVIQKIYTYSLDKFTVKGNHGHGTTGPAVKLLADWLGSFCDDKFSVITEYLEGKHVNFKNIEEALEKGGVALIKIHTTSSFWHYILVIKSKNGWVECFDPDPHRDSYWKKLENAAETLKVKYVHDPNLRIRKDWLNQKSNNKKYVLGEDAQRECVLLKRNRN